MNDVTQPSTPTHLASELAALFEEHPYPPYHVRWREIRHRNTPPGIDDVSLALLATYCRCLSLSTREARWIAQVKFHEAQLARNGGGTKAMKLGSQLQRFLCTEEEQRS